MSSLPVRFTSLKAATTTGAGSSYDELCPRWTHSMQVILTGAPTAVVVTLEGSADGITWGTLATYTYNATTAPSGTFVGIDMCCSILRANLTTLTGGTSPTVTAIIQSVT